jgi:hypothetical protein
VVPAIVDARRLCGAGVPDADPSADKLGHGFVTDDKGPACDYTGKPYIIDCDYDQAGALLEQIYGPLNPPASEASGTFLVFDQRAHTRDLSNDGLSDEGMVYIPRACMEGAGCRVQSHFPTAARTTVWRRVCDQLARWADTNNHRPLSCRPRRRCSTARLLDWGYRA